MRYAYLHRAWCGSAGKQFHGFTTLSAKKFSAHQRDKAGEKFVSMTSSNVM